MAESTTVASVAQVHAAHSSGPRPLRAMLARGAACDLCRARKVKCDGLRPVCSQCTKSSRGNNSEINCVYEGGASARAGGKKRSSGAAAVVGASTDGVSLVEDKPAAVQGKRSRESGSDEGEGEDEVEESTRRETVRTGGKKRASAGGQRVETLVERISELERRLRLQSQPVPAAVHTHVRASASPPFYPTPYLPHLPSGTTSVPMEARRSLSGAGHGVGAEPTSKDIAAAWTPESSVRFTNGRQTDAATQPTRSYASFIPPLPHLAAFDDCQLEAELPPFNGGSYPPLNYSKELGLNGLNGPPQTNGDSLPPPSARPSYPSHDSYPLPPAFDPTFQLASDPLQRAYQKVAYDLHDSGFTTSSSTEHSVAPSPEDLLSLSVDASLLQLFYPAWPNSLPAPSTVHHLLNVFFNRATVPSAMFSKARLLAALELAPLDPGFPSTALLHAICAYAVPWVSLDALVTTPGVKAYWADEKSPREYHYRCARKEIDETVMTNSKSQSPKKRENLFQILQATLLCCYLAYHEATFTDLWMLSGLATRLCTPLGLNHLSPWDFSQDKCGPRMRNWRDQVINIIGDHMDHALLPPPRDAEEHYERAATWWVAFSIDRHTSASTDWSTSIDELDVSTPLPIRSFAPEAAISLRHEKFFQETSLSLGTQGLLIKAVILLGRVVNYLQRIPRTMVMKPGETCTTLRERLKSEPDFVELDFALAKFRTLTSADFFKVDHAIDSHLASAYAIPHAASILLHEPFCDRQDRSSTSSAARCFTSAKCVINSTFVMVQSSNDLSGLDPFLVYCWSVVGRALVRDCALKTLWGDVDGAVASQTLAEHCVLFTSRCAKSGTTVPVLEHTSKALQRLLDDPARLLPMDPDNLGPAQKCGAPWPEDPFPEPSIPSI